MYNLKTTIIVGAGASFELGMPTGDKLKGIIQNLLDIQHESLSNTVKKGSREIARALRKYADYQVNSENADKYNKNLRAGWHIKDALTQAISIDNFVDNMEDEHITRMAKLAITQAILEAESNSKLATNKDDHSGTFADWNSIEDTWIHELFKTLTEGIKKSDVSKILNNISFVIFNYDRTIEHFLTNAIVSYYRISATEAEQIINDGTFLHPYGTTGKMQWQTNGGPIAAFGAKSTDNLLEISAGIKTFTEQIEDKTEINKIQSIIEQSDQLIFLGFAYHDANMELLQPIRARNTKRVIGTAYGISDSDCEVINSRLLQLCLTAKFIHTGYGKFILDNKSTCTELFTKYGRLIRS